MLRNNNPIESKAHRVTFLSPEPVKRTKTGWQQLAFSVLAVALASAASPVLAMETAMSDWHKQYSAESDSGSNAG